MLYPTVSCSNNSRISMSLCWVMSMLREKPSWCKEDIISNNEFDTFNNPFDRKAEVLTIREKQKFMTAVLINWVNAILAMAHYQTGAEREREREQKLHKSTFALT